MSWTSSSDLRLPTPTPPDAVPFRGREYTALVYHGDQNPAELHFLAEPKVQLDMDHFISRADQDTLRAALLARRDQLRVVLVIPTYDSADYIQDSLRAMVDQIHVALRTEPQWRFELVVSLNGVAQHETLASLLDFQPTIHDPRVSLTVIHLDGIQGKVNALNAGATFAMLVHGDLMGFIDDDVRYTGDSLLRVLDYLTAHPHVYLVGPHGGPSRRRDSSHTVFERLETLASSDSVLPLGQGQFFPVAAYPMIPPYVINDDFYLAAYFALPDGHANIWHRIALIPGTFVYWNLTRSLRLYLTRLVRLTIGIRQNEAIFGSLKQRHLGTFAGKPMHQRAALRELFGGMNSPDRLKMFGLILHLYVSRAAIQVWTDLKVSWRRWRGEYPYRTAWHAVPTTKRFPSGYPAMAPNVASPPGPSKHSVWYHPALGRQLALACGLSALLACWTFIATQHRHFAVVSSTVLSITCFALGFAQIKHLVGMLLLFTNRQARDALLHKPVITPVYRNRRLYGTAEPTTRLTLMVPIYNESFDVIRESSLRSSVDEVMNYGPHANLLVLDDGLMVFANNDLDAFEREAASIPPFERTRDHTEVLQRLDFYRTILAKRDIRFGVVARPKPVPGHPETERRGSFKKGSNLNFAHRVFELTQELTKQQVPDAHAIDVALERQLGPSRAWAYVQGDVSIGDVILLLDKDSTVPEGISREAVHDFGSDPTLSYIQAVTSPSNRGDNFFTRMVGYYTALFYEFTFPTAVLLGSNVPLVGHNAYIRTAHLREAGYWREDRASEDYSFALDVAAKGHHGKYLDLPDLTFQETVSRDVEEEMGKVSRYAFGAAEIVAHPIHDWRRKGVLTEQIKRLIRSPHVPLRVKVDVLTYLQVYFNRILVLPLVILAGYWPLRHLGVMGISLGVMLSAGYAAGLSLAVRSRTSVAAESLARTPCRYVLYSLLYRLNVLGSTYVIVKSITQYLCSVKPDHPASGVGERERVPLQGLLKEMIPALVRTSVLSSMFVAGALLGDWRGIPWLDRWCSYYGFLNLILGPFLLSPRFLDALRQAVLQAACPSPKTQSGGQAVDLSAPIGRQSPSMISMLLHLLRLCPFLCGSHRQLALEKEDLVGFVPLPQIGVGVTEGVALGVLSQEDEHAPPGVGCAPRRSGARPPDARRSRGPSGSRG